MIGSVPENQGMFVVASVAAPGAGGSFTITGFPLTRLRVIGVRFRFVTDATVVNRQVYWELINATVACCRQYTTFIQPASTTTVYNYVPGVPTLGQAAVGDVMVHFPYALWLVSTVSWLRISADGLQAGDVFDQIFYYREELLNE